MPSLPTDVSLLNDALAGRYVLQRELGRGGMATVYLATDVRHARDVAIKVLHEAASDALTADRFHREIALLARLQHPHIVPLLDSGEAAGRLWYSMPVIQGESLRDRLSRERQLPLEGVVAIAGDVAGALDYAHGRGIVHRDVKPENILLTHGQAMVADFGIARLVEAAPSDGALTQTGFSVGTPAYMSPEQAAGERGVEGRADVYALGAVLYEMLAGEPPYTGPTPQAIIAKRFASPTPSIRVVRPDVSAQVDQTLSKALALSPAGRYSTAGQLAAALAASRDDNVAMTPLRNGGAKKVGARRLLLFGLPVVALLVLAVLLVRPRAAAATPVAVAVLPFENIGPDSTRYFTDGLTEAVTQRLASLPNLLVIDQHSANQYAHTEKSLNQIGRELGVGFVVRGSVSWAVISGAEKARVLPSLVRVRDGATTWSGAPTVVQVSNAFEVQGQIAEEVANALGIALANTDVQALHDSLTRNPEAYDLYLRAREYDRIAKESGAASREVFAQPLTLYRSAIQLDPKFAVARAYLSIVLGWISLDEGSESSAAHEALAQADTALRLAPALSMAQLAQGFALDIAGRSAAALRRIKQAHASDPGNALASAMLANGLSSAGQLTDADTLTRRALRRNPRSYDLLRSSAQLALQLRQLDRADSLAQRMLELEPGDGPAFAYRVEAAMGRADTARAHEIVSNALHVRKLSAYFWAGIGDIGDSERKLLAHLSWDRVATADRRDSIEVLSARATAAMSIGDSALGVTLFDSVWRRSNATINATSDTVANAWVMAKMGVAAARTGRRESARATQRWLLALPDSLAREWNYRNHEWSAEIAGQLGNSAPAGH